MKKLNFLMLFALLTLAMPALAQESVNQYEFKKHGFINLQGGVQHTLGETKFMKLLSPNVQVAVGYQFTPVFGMRLQANGWQSKGGWSGYQDVRYGNPYTNVYSYKYVAPGLDLNFSLSNLFAGFNPKRVLDVVLFVGGGANIAFDNKQVNAIAKQLGDLHQYYLENLWDGRKIQPFGRAGLDLNFRLSDAVALVLEGNANILSDKYNSKKADNPDWYFNALAGLKINLGKSYAVKEVADLVPAATEEIVALEQPQTPAVKPAEQPTQVEQTAELQKEVFFEINKTDVRDEFLPLLQEIADFLKANPEAKVAVTGYADAGTGTPNVNDVLSAGRALAVSKLLIGKYGVDESRIVVSSKGDRVQPFAENDKNRVTICIAKPADKIAQ